MMLVDRSLIAIILDSILTQKSFKDFENVLMFYFNMKSRQKSFTKLLARSYMLENIHEAKLLLPITRMTF